LLSSTSDDAQEHASISAELRKRGSVFGLIDNSRDFKKVLMGGIIHDTPQNVEKLLSRDANNGAFKRKVRRDDGRGCWIRY
jgi:hypothetical protein